MIQVTVWIKLKIILLSEKGQAKKKKMESVL